MIIDLGDDRCVPDRDTKDTELRRDQSIRRRSQNMNEASDILASRKIRYIEPS